MQETLYRYLDSEETDITMRCINWCVDVFVLRNELSKAMRAKWSRVNRILGVH